VRLTLTMTVTAIGSLLFGLAYLLVPASVASLYGITLDPSGQYARFFGSALLGFAAILWLGRKVTSGPALRSTAPATRSCGPPSSSTSCSPSASRTSCFAHRLLGSFLSRKDGCRSSSHLQSGPPNNSLKLTRRAGPSW
jgi:hypothetical protein